MDFIWKILNRLPPFSWRVEANIWKHRAEKAEGLLWECYRKVPYLHYENCSDYAKFALFKRNELGIIVYKNPEIRTISQPHQEDKV